MSRTSGSRSELALPALGARVGGWPGARQMAVGTRPDRDLVPPPELARDAPVRRLLEGLDREAVLALRVEADAALAQRLEGRRGEPLHRAPPLRRDERLDARVAPFARPDRVAVRLALLDEPALVRPREHAGVGLLLVEALESLGDHPPVRPDHGERLEAVVAADVEVHRVVARRHLDGAGAELGVDAGVGDDGHPALDDGDDDLAADRLSVPRIVGVHGNRDVGEHRRGPHRRDRDPALRAVGERVAHIRERVVHLDVLDLEIRDRRLVIRAPVDDPVRAVDPACVPETDEEGHHRLDVRLVHREALARVVERRAEAAVLAHDRPPGRLEPAPRPLEERVAADLLPRRPLRDELLLDDVLRRDTGVVVAGLPERVEAPHPVPADQHVLDRAVERVPHVQLAGHVRRRHADHERLVAAAPRAGGVETVGLPRLLPAPFDGGRVVQRLHQARECTERLRQRGRGSCWCRARGAGSRGPRRVPRS